MEDEPEFQADDGSGIAKPMWEPAIFCPCLADDFKQAEAIFSYNLVFVKVGLSSVLQNKQLDRQRRVNQGRKRHIIGSARERCVGEGVILSQLCALVDGPICVLHYSFLFFFLPPLRNSQWRTLSDADRDYYEGLANEDRERYRRECAVRARWPWNRSACFRIVQISQWLVCILSEVVTWNDDANQWEQRQRSHGLSLPFVSPWISTAITVAVRTIYSF